MIYRRKTNALALPLSVVIITMKIMGIARLLAGWLVGWLSVCVCVCLVGSPVLARVCAAQKGKERPRRSFGRAGMGGWHTDELGRSKQLDNSHYCLSLSLKYSHDIALAALCATHACSYCLSALISLHRCACIGRHTRGKA